MLKNKKISRLIQLLLLLNSATILIPNKFKAYPVVLLLIASLYNFYMERNEKKFPIKKIICLSILFFLYFIGVVYSFNFEYGFKKISTMSSLIVFPLIFSLLSSSFFVSSKSFLNKLFLTFVLSNILFSIICFVYILNLDGYTINTTLIHYSNSVSKGIGLFSIHPIYFSLYIGISIIMLSFLIKENLKNPILTIVFALLICFLGVVLSVLMRKGPIIYLFISLSYVLYKIFNIKKLIYTISALLIITILSIQFLPKYKNYNRFLEISSTTAYAETGTNSTLIRYNIYKCTIEKIKESFFFGYGVGNTQQQLDPCYKEKGIYNKEETYNCHNQYLSVFLNIGVIGFMIFIFSLYKTFLLINKNHLAVGVFIFFLLNFLTENIIERENGILLYSFFLSLFVFYDTELKTTS